MALLHRAWSAIAGHEITSGKVVELLPKSGGKGTTYKVVAIFQDRTGNKHTCTSRVASNPPENNVGDVVKIMYDRENPDRNDSLQFGNRLGLGWILLGFGLFLLWIAIGWQIGRRHRQFSLSEYPLI